MSELKASDLYDMFAELVLKPSQEHSKRMHAGMWMYIEERYLIHFFAKLVSELTNSRKEGEVS